MVVQKPFSRDTKTSASAGEYKGQRSITITLRQLLPEKADSCNRFEVLKVTDDKGRVDYTTGEEVFFLASGIDPEAYVPSYAKPPANQPTDSQIAEQINKYLEAHSFILEQSEYDSIASRSDGQLYYFINWSTWPPCILNTQNSTTRTWQSSSGTYVLSPAAPTGTYTFNLISATGQTDSVKVVIH